MAAAHPLQDWRAGPAPEADRIAAFVRDGAAHVPGVLYSFNIADFSRRNMHLGHRVGDRDIERLEELLAGVAPDATLVRRIDGGRWFALSRVDAMADVAKVLAAFATAESLRTGWRIVARKGRRRAEREAVVDTTMRRAIRCLSAAVATTSELAAAIEVIRREDYSLPLDVILPLSTLDSTPRRRWSCVEAYPDASPACPFCGGRTFAWTDGDMSVYAGDGDCPCGAKVSIKQIS